MDYAEEQACNNGPCAVDCVMEEWSAWGACSETLCGGGTQVRTRAVAFTDANGGKACPMDLSESQACMTNPCPIDCDISEWSSYSACSGNWKSRTRTINTFADFGGMQCPNTLTDAVKCNP
jgi:hypothetical protein